MEMGPQHQISVWPISFSLSTLGTEVSNKLILVFLPKFKPAHWTALRRQKLVKNNIQSLKLFFLFGNASE